MAAQGSVQSTYASKRDLRYVAEQARSCLVWGKLVVGLFVCLLCVALGATNIFLSHT